ncbi:MAG: hypothetical protein Unbinned221contig1000_8 [Prokaryotic dsDNA virus sp.]|nr:MAG: hypothetical protein Unbinned221contig1000_8 [Prokaryotic dsDNA virus sp.]|tara:strand:+ start:2311 stop:4650 length:2340 start_codon:yes stop_codon:yes gene_type:complete
MSSVQVYIEGRRLELFNDEQINIKSSQQNIKEIDKVKTDFSKSFNIPCTPNNNQIFEHFYESDVNMTYDQNLRRNASIEIDLVPFKEGQISMSKAKVTEGHAESYEITFYGNLTSLKDKFGEEKLSDIDELSDINYDYTEANVRNSITSSSLASVKFPLILNRTLSNVTDNIDFTELFPAINLLTIINKIQTRYGITFSGTFFGEDRFKQAYMLFKNSEDMNFRTESKSLSLSPIVGGGYIANDTVSYENQPFNELFPNITPPFLHVQVEQLNNIKHKTFIEIANVNDTNAFYHIEVYNNGVLFKTLAGSGNATRLVNKDESNKVLNRNFTFRIYADRPLTCTFNITYRQEGKAFFEPTMVSQTDSNEYTATSSVSLSGDIDFKSLAPEIKVMDFFKGVLNMFNLTCYGLGNDVYQVETLDSFYAKGTVRDITKYVDSKSVEINKVPLFRRINFEYQKSESVTNAFFLDTFGHGYGNAKNQFNYDGGEFNVKLPFENIMFGNYESSDLHLGYTIKSDLSKYIPKPTILYANGLVTQDVKISNTTESEYLTFGQDLTVNGIDYTLNFMPLSSTRTGNIVDNTLYKTYYEGYLSNLYNLKNRNVKVSARLPIDILSKLELNDRLIIRGKRYVINSLDVELTSQMAKLDLLMDFTETIAEGSSSSVPIIQTDGESQCIDVPVSFPNNTIQADITDVLGNITSITPSQIPSEQSISVCIPENTTSEAFLLTESGDFLQTEDGISLVNQEQTSGGVEEQYVLKITYTFIDGSQSESFVLIEQQP